MPGASFHTRQIPVPAVPLRSIDGRSYPNLALPLHSRGSPAETREGQMNADRSSARFPWTNANAVFAAYVAAPRGDTRASHAGGVLFSGGETSQ